MSKLKKKEPPKKKAAPKAGPAANKVPPIKKIEAKRNIFDSALADDIKHGTQNFVDTANANFCSSINCMNENNKMTQKLMNKLKDNLSKSMNDQIQTSLDSLSCRTASDFVQLMQNNFQKNFETAMKFNNDFIELMNHCTVKSYRHTNDCLSSSLNNLTK